MSSFVLKVLACISMFIDHLGFMIPNSQISLYMRLFGRLAFPIFAFQLTEGYIHTKNIKKYFTRLFILAIISQIPFSLYFNTSSLNIFFTLFLGLLGIHIYSTYKHKSISIIIVIFIAIIASILKVDYSYYGVLLIFIFYIFKNNKLALASTFILLTFIFNILRTSYISSYIIQICIATSMAILPILFYNGKQGKKVKYLFYAFYPVHIILLCFVKNILFWTY